MQRTVKTIKTMVRGAYDLQKLRIQMGNRIVANFKVKHGQEPGKPEDTISAEGKKILRELRSVYDILTDGVAALPSKKSFKGNEVISDYTELSLIAHYTELEQAEASQFRRLKSALDDYPLWTEYLTDVKGIGPAMAGVIISEIDISKAQYPSSLWKYAGLDVAEDGRGRSRRKEHLVEVSYVDKKGEEKVRNSITFNPFLRTKLIGVLATSFLRSGKHKYSDIYYDYKHRLEHHEAHKEKTPKHRHNMAIRYMMKRFLVDLYLHWRKLEGLPVSEEYSVAKLGKIHKLAS